MLTYLTVQYHSLVLFQKQKLAECHPAPQLDYALNHYPSRPQIFHWLLYLVTTNRKVRYWHNFECFIFFRLLDKDPLSTHRHQWRHSFIVLIIVLNLQSATKKKINETHFELLSSRCSQLDILIIINYLVYSQRSTYEDTCEII